MFEHTSIIREAETGWNNVDLTRLPMEAYAEIGEDGSPDTWRWPHHNIEATDYAVDQNDRLVNGKMVLNVEGLNWALEGAKGERGGIKASKAAIDHLEQHLKDIGKYYVQREGNPLPVRILKSMKSNQVVIGIVAEPYTVDGQNHWASPETIEKAAHEFMLNPNYAIGVGHDEYISNVQIRKDAKTAVVESFISPVDMMVNDEVIKQGSWVLGVKVFDNDLWAEVESGKLNGFSMHGDGFLRKT